MFSQNEVFISYFRLNHVIGNKNKAEKYNVALTHPVDSLNGCLSLKNGGTTFPKICEINHPKF